MDSAPSLSCASCGAECPSGSRFCPGCGVERGSGVSATFGRMPEVVTVPDAPPVSVAPAARVTPSIRPMVSRRPTVADPLIGQVIADRYRIVSMLGRGGMGVVYKVEHVHIGKLMALKLLSGELARDPHTVRRFRREAKAISTLTHPNTVQIFDFGQSAKLAYLVMEYLPGKDFATVIAEQGPLPFVRVARICAQVAASVGEAHAAGIIHRDIKPENVMIVDAPGQQDLVKVLDFGIAKLRDTEDVGSATASGHLVGTPYYMAPEQIRAEPYDHRVDIYALGAMMYKALSGVPPFTADTPMAVLSAHLTSAVVPLRTRLPDADLPEAADEIIGHALQKDPKQRYASMHDVRADLLAYLYSVGELDTTDELVMRSRSLKFAHFAAQSVELATRGDVDRYQRRITRTGWLASVLGVIAVVALTLAGLELWGQRPGRLDTAEQEPNDTPATANVLKPGQPLRAFLGKRRSVTYGDADVYAFDVPLNETRIARLSVTALPNMDLALDVVRKGESTPVLLADTGRFAEPELVANLGLRGGTSYLRVREQWASGNMPTENVSDAYIVTLRYETPGPGDEREPNDRFDIAETLSSAAPRHGFLGWALDRDVYCVAAGWLPARVRVEAVPSLDLVLSATDRASDVVRVIDEHGVAEGESLDIEASPGARPCVTLSVRDEPLARRADAETRYTLQLLRL